MTTRSPTEHATDVLLPGLILLAPFLSFIKYHDYGLRRPETLLWIMIWAGIGLLGGIVLYRSGPVGRVAVMTLSLLAFVDLQFDGLDKIGVRRFALVALGVGVVVWLMRVHAAAILTAAFATMVAATLVLPGGPPALTVVGNGSMENGGMKAELGPMIHLILDEHIGVEGLPVELPAANELRRRLKALFERYGFRLYGRAYSQYVDTANSIPNLLNFSTRDVTNAYFGGVQESSSLREDLYFERMAQKGYKLRIYQSDFISYCEAANVSPEFCLTYRQTGISAIAPLDLAVWQKMKFIGNSYLHRSLLVDRVKTVWDWLSDSGLPLPEVHEGVRQLGPIPSQQVLDRLRRDVLDSGDGKLFFAHLVTPHYPYIYDSGCTMKPEISQWLIRRNDRFDNQAPMGNSDESRQVRYENYIEQATCLAGQLDSFLQALSDNGVLSRATIVIQGDHGSRITRQNLKVANLPLAPSDYLDGFSTLFAVRAPNVAPGYDPDPIPIARALAKVIGFDPVGIETDDVFIVDESAPQMQRRPMPAVFNPAD